MPGFGWPPEYRRAGNGDTAWYAYDGLGSVLGEIDGSTGNLATSRVYGVYGHTRAYSGTSASRHHFVGSLGHPSEAETGLVYMRARYMDPALGRFISEDPAHNGGNWFIYASDDPINLTDLSGKADIGTYQAMFIFGELCLGLHMLMAAGFAATNGWNDAATTTFMGLATFDAALIIIAAGQFNIPKNAQSAMGIVGFATGIAASMLVNVQLAGLASRYNAAAGGAVVGTAVYAAILEAYIVATDHGSGLD